MTKTIIKSWAVLLLCSSCKQIATPLSDLDTIKNAKVFELNSQEAAALSTADTLFAKAFAFLNENDIDSLPLGIQYIDGDNLFVNVQDVTLKPIEDGLLEAHDAYYDIQIPLTQSEHFGIASREGLTCPRGKMDRSKDIIFFNDSFASNIVEVKPKQVIVLAPHIAHAPCLGEGMHRKVVFKLKVQQ